MKTGKSYEIVVKKGKKRVGQEQEAIEEQTENKENVWREIQADENAFHARCHLPRMSMCLALWVVFCASPKRWQHIHDMAKISDRPK